MIIAYCVICSYVCVIHFLLSINADDDRSKKDSKAHEGTALKRPLKLFTVIN